MEEDDFVMLSALQHYSYCPRQCALIHEEQSFAENLHTAYGNAVHALVDLESHKLKAGTLRTFNGIDLALRCGSSRRCYTQCSFPFSTQNSHDWEGFANAEHHPAAMPGVD